MKHMNTTGQAAAALSIADVRSIIDEGDMSRLQILAVIICTVINMLDGYDVLVVAFVSPSLSADWQLTGTQLGMLLSAGPVGMALGSLLVAPWADRYGRRATILLCLGIVTLGMLFSALAQDVTQLRILRVLTGIGIGGMLASIGVITAEYSSTRYRSRNVSIQATGYPIGAAIGGTIAAVLIELYGWRAAFLFGAIASALMIPVVLRYLPESLDFLLMRQPPNALNKLNALLRRMRRAPIDQLPNVTAAEERSVLQLLPGLFVGRLARSTLLLWTSFFMLMFSFYFIMSWTPKLLVATGLSAQQGVTGAVLLNVGGIIGGFLFAWLAGWIVLRRLTASFLTLTAVSAIAFGMLASSLPAAFTIAVAIGIFLIGSMAGLYSLAPTIYSASVRTTGMGWAIGIGRIGAILAPTLAGVFVDADWTTKTLYVVFAVPLLVAVVSVLGVGAYVRGRELDAQMALGARRHSQ
jgi:benzoate transport